MKNNQKICLTILLVLLFLSLLAAYVNAETNNVGLELEGGECKQDDDCSFQAFCVGKQSVFYAHNDVQTWRVLDAVNEGFQGVCYKRYQLLPDGSKVYKETTGIAAYCEKEIEYVQNHTIEYRVNETIKYLNNTETLTTEVLFVPKLVYFLWTASIAIAVLASFLTLHGIVYKFHGVKHDNIYKTLFGKKLLYRKRISREKFEQKMILEKENHKRSFVSKVIKDDKPVGKSY